MDALFALIGLYLLVVSLVVIRWAAVEAIAWVRGRPRPARDPYAADDLSGAHWLSPGGHSRLAAEASAGGGWAGGGFAGGDCGGGGGDGGGGC